MNKVFYIANIRLPTEKAHGIQIMKSCEAIAEQGIDVILLIPSRKGNLKHDPFEYYKVKKIFLIKKVPCLDLTKLLKEAGFNIQTVSFLIMSLFFLPWRNRKTILYSRDQFFLNFYSLFFKNIFWETHMGNLQPLTKRLLRKVKGIVCISQGLIRFYTNNGVPENKLCLAPDAVDLDQFTLNLDKKRSRLELKLPENNKIITYTGSIYYSWKGVDIFVEAANKFDNQNHFMIVGGGESEIDKIRSNAKNPNINFVGQKPYNQIPIYLNASDILVLPNKKGDIISEEYTSPMKLFEYMASGVPVIASDLPSIREVLTEKNSLLIEPNNPDALANAIETILSNPDLGGRIALQAKLDIREYSWNKRGKKITDFIKLKYEK